MQITPNQLLTFHWNRQNFAQIPVQEDPAQTRIGLYGAAPTCYLALLARDPGFAFSDLDTALYEEHRLARVRAMRNTQFLLPPRWIPMAHQAIGRQNAEAYRRLVEKSGVTPASAEQILRDVLDLLADQDLTASEIKKSLGVRPGPISSAFSFLLALLSAEGHLIRARVRGSWKSNLYTYTRFDRWLPDVELDSISPAEARTELARLYLSSYGPARASDFQWWAGLSQGEAASALEGLNDSTLSLMVSSEGPYYMLKNDAGGLQGTPDRPPQGVALLPVWDAYLMAYAERAWFVPDDWYDRVYDSGGNATSTLFVDGRAAGVWDFEMRRKRLDLRLGFFGDPPAGVREAARAYGTRLAVEIGAADLRVRFCQPPPPLGPAIGSRFRSPLKDCEVLDQE